ncbi:MAG: PEP-CTERM sorting domain-containing protein, partial [Sedimentisphaerales bacterium]|nr:PEP-CTERM sorting domain-containing protein [Sedimentisphaerales bacterium]
AEAIILDVNVFPEQPTINDEIAIITSGITSLGGIQIEGSDFEMQGNSLLLDIFIRTGAATVEIPYLYSENIGTLPAGLYDLTVRNFETSLYDITHTYTYSTTFEVVPEPSTLVLLSFGFIQVMRRRR